MAKEEDTVALLCAAARKWAKWDARLQELLGRDRHSQEEFLRLLGKAGKWRDRTLSYGHHLLAAVVPVVRTTTIGTSDKPIDVWIGAAEPPAVLPKGPSCCCTDPPTPMGLTFYMDSSVGPVQRVDAKCPACGAVVKGLKL